MVENILLSLLPTPKVRCEKFPKKKKNKNLIGLSNDPSQQRGFYVLPLSSLL
jgi:hypothetical protein